MPSRGSVAFDKILSGLPHGERGAAKIVGCSPAAINLWRHAKRIPGRAFACKLHDLWGLDPRWWEQPAKPPRARRTPETTTLAATGS